MDIRDIQESEEYSNDALGRIFSLQKELIDHYVGIEGLPQYPIDINTKASQIILKDFIGRIIEELGEAWESYEIMMKMKDLGEVRELMIPHLQNFNEEVADAIHFWCELMIYSGFETYQMGNWLCKEMGIGPWFITDTLEGFLILGKGRTEFLHTKPVPLFMVIREEPKNLFLMGGRGLGIEQRSILKQQLWDITFHLQIARNTFKNKPWKQSHMMTDENLYEKEIKEATIAMFRFFSFAGFTKESLFEIYYKKNRVNNFRIKSKY